MKTILFYVFLIFLWVVISSLIANNLLDNSLGQSQKINGSSSSESFFLIFLIGPIIETILFQTLVFYCCDEMITHSNKKWFFIVISGAGFGLSHFYNIYFALAAIPSGMLLAHAFYTNITRTNYLNATLIVIMIHILSNLMVLVAKIIY